MAQPILLFPTLPVLGLSIHWQPIFSTLSSEHVSGREVLSPQQAFPLHEFTLTFGGDSWLRDQTQNQSIYHPNAPHTELQQIAGLFLACQGKNGLFYFDYFSDDSRSSSYINTGNGTTASFIIPRYFGPYQFGEPVGGINSIQAVYFNGTEQSPSIYSVSGNVITFTSPPGGGIIITADFTFYYLCHFLEDQHDYEQFMYNLFKLKTCKIRSFKLGFASSVPTPP